jgi:hypothetical protein
VLHWLEYTEHLVNMSRIFKRPMFRKGGPTNDGIMTGIVDRENHAVSDPDGVGGPTEDILASKVQNKLDLIEAVTGKGTGLDDPLTSFLLQYGPALATARPTGGIIGTAVGAAKEPVANLLKDVQAQKKLKTGVALEVLEDLDDDDISALKKKAEAYAKEGYMGGNADAIFKELVNKELYKDRPMPSEAKKETQEVYLASLMKNDEYLNAYTGEQVVSAIDNAKQGKVPGLDPNNIFYEKPYLDSEAYRNADKDPETGVITLQDIDADEYPTGTAIYDLRTKKWYNVQGQTLTPIMGE